MHTIISFNSSKMVAFPSCFKSVLFKRKQHHYFSVHTSPGPYSAPGILLGVWCVCVCTIHACCPRGTLCTDTLGSWGAFNRSFISKKASRNQLGNNQGFWLRPLGSIPHENTFTNCVISSLKGKEGMRR